MELAVSIIRNPLENSCTASTKGLQCFLLVDTLPIKWQGSFSTPSTHPRSGRAYCSTKDWPNSRYPENNIEDKVREELQIREQSHLVFGAPGNDITNIDNIADRAEQYRMAVKSSENCISTAEKALTDFPLLEKVVILERLPRVDHLSDLSEYSNFALRVLAEKSKLSQRILVCPMESLHHNTEKRMIGIFGSPKSRSFDGIHLRGKLGSRLYNESIISAFRIARIAAPRSWERIEEPEEINTRNRFDLLN